MIALNEIISNKEKFEQKYRLMGKNICLDKIIKLEEVFIKLDKKANELRSNCNKLCSEIAELVNSNKDTKEAILNINKLDREIISLEKKSNKAMNKINKILKKLPNPSLEENVLNIAVKTNGNQTTKDEFIAFLNEISTIKDINYSTIKYLNSFKKAVFKAELLPIFVKNKNKFLLLCGSNGLEILEKIQQNLSSGAKYLIIKSIKSLKKTSSKELYATLFDGTSVCVEFSGEFVSREKSIKLYDKNLDMTKFVNLIQISIK